MKIFLVSHSNKKRDIPTATITTTSESQPERLNCEQQSINGLFSPDKILEDKKLSSTKFWLNVWLTHVVGYLFSPPFGTVDEF